MKKSGFLKNVLGTIRQQQQQQQQDGNLTTGVTQSADFQGLENQLKPQHLSLGVVARHGVPERPTALAYDPVQRLAAIGTATGFLRVFGRPGAEASGQHTAGAAVTHIRFIVNQGALITVTADGALHLWSLRGVELKLQFANANNSANSGLTPTSYSPAPSVGGSLTPVQPSREPSPVAGGRGGTNTESLVNANGGSLNSLDSNPATNQDRNTESKQPQCLHTLRFQQREQITCLHQTVQSKWLYLGTKRGNVHIVNLETFQLSSYSIPWNKTIELDQRNHPGPIIHLSECPVDSNKLLIGYQTGCIVLWDSTRRCAEYRYQWPSVGELKWISWQPEAKQFICAHASGSLVTWSVRNQQAKPVQVTKPKSQPSLDTSLPESPIDKVEWRCNRNGDQTIVFGQESSVTVMQTGRQNRSVDIGEQIVDFVLITDQSPYDNEPGEVQTALILFTNQLKALDLSSATNQALHWLECPAASSHLIESPVTSIQYLADCQQDLVPLLYSAGLSLKSSTATNKQNSTCQWPIDGGEWSQPTQSYSELIITGHANGFVKFWEASGVNFNLLASMGTSQMFEATPESHIAKDNMTAIELIEYNTVGRRLLLAGSGCQVLQFLLKRDTPSGEAVVQVPCPVSIKNQSYPLSCSLLASNNSIAGKAPLAAGKQQPVSALFQPELVCLTAWAVERARAPRIVALCFEPSHKMLAYAHENGLALIDTIQKSVIMSSSMSQLYSGNSSSFCPSPGIKNASSSSLFAADPSPVCNNNNKQTNTSNGEGTTTTNGSGSASNTNTANNNGPPTAATAASAAVVARDANDGEEPLVRLPGAKSSVEQQPSQQKQVPQSRFTTNSMFQRQLSSATLAHNSPEPSRLFRRQMTAAQLPFAANQQQQQQQQSTNKPSASSRLRAAALLASESARKPRPATASAAAASPAAGLPSSTPSKQRIIRRMLSISRAPTDNATGGEQHSDGGQQSATGQTLANEQTDSSFVRSRSSSGDSGLANNQQQSNQQPLSDSIQCLCFLDWPSTQRQSQQQQPQPQTAGGHSADWPGESSNGSNNKSLLSDSIERNQLILWLGTAQGCLLLVEFILPDTEDNRELQLQSVIAEPAPQVVARCAGSILCLSSFIGQTTPSNNNSNNKTTIAKYLSVVSEKEAKVYLVPQCIQLQQRDWSAWFNKLTLAGSTKLSQSSYACTSSVAQWSGQASGHLLNSYLATGSLIVHSLPKLAPLLEADFVPYSNPQVAASMRFSRQGHALYQPSQGELCKFTLSTQYKALVNEMTGALYVPRDMPDEPARAGSSTSAANQFFKSLLAATNLATAAGKQSARDELFGETPAASSRSVAKHIGGGLDKIRGQSAVGGEEFRIARENLDERGEKLSEIEDRTYQMMNQSESYAQTANQLVQKFKDKKWYQF